MELTVIKGEELGTFIIIQPQPITFQPQLIPSQSQPFASFLNQSKPVRATMFCLRLSLIEIALLPPRQSKSTAAQ